MQNSSALLIIDVQRGFINQHTKEIPSLVEQEQKNYEFVWAAQLEYTKDSPFLKIRKHSGFNNVDKPTEFAFALRPDAETIVKHGYSAATEEFLDALKAHNITQVDLMGMDTDQCVLATALALFDQGITPRVIVDCCASTGGSGAHNAGIAIMRRALGDQNMIINDPHIKTDTITGRINAKALEILEENPEGVRWTDMLTMIKQSDPSLHPKTINGCVWKLVEKFPDKVYKPEKGLFRLKKYKNS